MIKAFCGLFIIVACIEYLNAFSPTHVLQHNRIQTLSFNRKVSFSLGMSDEKNEAEESTIATPKAPESAMDKAMREQEEKIKAPESAMDKAMREQEEKIARSEELRSQEVFMQRSTGKSKCTVCDWIFDESKGDIDTIGGLVQPGTAFSELPSNWRCPTCRASKDSFVEEVEEIPGFAVNQGYGFGGNALSGNAKTGLIFGGLALFFVLFLSGYAMS